MASQETDIAVMQEKQKSMEDDLKETKTAISALQEERTRALKWGVITLGSAIVGLFAWIASGVIGFLMRHS